MTYERFTAASAGEVLDLAQRILPERIPLERESGDRHAVTLVGPDGRVTISAHPHGHDTLVVARTDRLRTERIDLEAQYFLNQLPYEPGDRPAAGRGGEAAKLQPGR